jgi:hypothetical protein
VVQKSYSARVDRIALRLLPAASRERVAGQVRALLDNLTGDALEVGLMAGAVRSVWGAVELGADSLQLAALEFADGQATPAVGRPDHGHVHELQDGPFAKGVRDDLRSTPVPVRNLIGTRLTLAATLGAAVWTYRQRY